eukprot:jgi/Mesen1/6009/ME000306S05287
MTSELDGNQEELPLLGHTFIAARKYSIAPNHKPDDFASSKEVSKFINHANEVKAASLATKEGSQLRIIKSAAESSNAKIKKGGPKR